MTPAPDGPGTHRGGGPRVSVIMAVFNGERFLPQALDSILAQEYRDFELIVVNDGSTDSSGEIVESYRDPRVRLVENEGNLGLARSLNRGLELAVGEYVARQDADDVSRPDRLRRQVQYLDANPEVALVGSAHAEIDEAGAVLQDVEAHCDHVAIAWAMLFFCPFVHSSVMFRRREVLEDVGPYDPSYRYSMDYELWSRISARYRVANLPEQLVLLRMHGGSMTSTFGDRTREGHRLRVSRVARLLGVADRSSAAESLHARLSTLLFGPWRDPDPDSLLVALRDLFPLQQAFAHEQELSAADAAAQRAELREHTRLSMLDFGRTLSADTPAGWRTLLRFAWEVTRLHGWRSARRPGELLSLAGLIGRVVVGIPVARAARWLRSVGRPDL